MCYGMYPFIQYIQIKIKKMILNKRTKHNETIKTGPNQLSEELIKTGDTKRLKNDHQRCIGVKEK